MQEAFFYILLDDLKIDCTVNKWATYDTLLMKWRDSEAVNPGNCEKALLKETDAAYIFSLV